MKQCVNNKENRAWAKFANGVVPFLTLIMKNVSNRHSVWVIEDQGGGWEINAVSREVVFVLLLVVFESHPVIQTQDTMVYIHMSIQCFGAIGIGGQSESRQDFTKSVLFCTVVLVGKSVKANT
jgi:hypothetical protein